MNDTTSQKYMPMGVRVLAVITAGAFFFTSLGAAPAEASFWEERAAARNRQIHGTSSPVLLAQLPASQPLYFGGAAQPALPSFSPKLASLMGNAPVWAQGAVTPFADIRSVREGASGSPRVFLVMDAHDVYSAQRNVARLLARLGSQGKMVVGVEGTSGAFDLERHRGLLPGVGQAQLVDHLLKKGFLNGPEAYGLTAEQAPLLWGVEDEKLYDANVKAYRGTLGLEAETHSTLETLKKETLVRQSKIFSAELLELDREVQAQHEGRGDLGRYVKAVVAGASGSVVAPFVGRPGGLRATSKSPDKSGNYEQQGQVRRFMEAKSKEDGLSFPAVEQARAAFIERVSPRLSPFELDALVRETTAFRAGSKSGKEYYRDLVSLALSKGVPVSAYPAFQSYIEYVSLTDGIDVVALMDELEALEGRAYARLAQGESLVLAEWGKDLRLADRAVQHALTPREWDRFEERRGEMARLADRAEALGISRASAETLQTNLPRFAAFFEAAAARNHTLLENALAEAHQRGATLVTLVTGGFHAPALEKLLVEKNIAHMVLTPRIEELPDSAAGYLGAFAPTRTPLEKLLLGDRLFMNPPSATSVAVNNPENPFNPSAVALARAEMGYGAALAVLQGNLAEFVSLWSGRFGDATARVLGKASSPVVEVQFEGAGTALLVATSEGDGVSGESLTREMTKHGGTVVEAGKIAGANYALGGRNLSRFVPELLGGAAFLAWLGGSALAPPAISVAAGLLAGMILGGMSFRAILLATTYWHGLGHALVARVLGGPSVREGLAQYGEALSLKQIIPFSNIFIPGLSPAAEAPRMSVGNLSQGWKTRVTALVGPAVNLVAVVLLVPLAMLADAGSAQSLVLSFAGGVNLWMALTSISDYKMAFSGIGDALYCGNLGILAKRLPQDRGILPKRIASMLSRMWRPTVSRGNNSAGKAILSIKGFIRKRLLSIKRAKMDKELLTSFNKEILRRRITGSRPPDNFIQVISHSRFATGGPSEMKNAHPFVWGLVEGFWNALFPLKARVWTVGEGGILKNLRRVAQQIISHNGDFDAWVRQKGEAPIPNNGPLAGWLTIVLGRKDPSEGDSPKIAGMLELLLTQGQWGASFRLAYAIDVADSMNDVMKQSVVRKIGRSADKVFESWLKEAHVAGCRTLQDVLNQNGAKVEELRQNLLNATRMDTQGLSQEKKDLLVDRAMHYFFFNDLQEAGRFFSDRADGTFGVVLESSLYLGEVVFGSFKQPIYVGIDPEKESVVYASELSSVKAAGEPGKDQVAELLPYIYFMEKGEVAHFKIGEGDIPNSVAFPTGFDFLGTSGFPDLSGSEMGGRHSLTVENLERWASENEREGGRGWIGTRDNKNLSGGVSVAESADLVLDTLNDVPKVLATINADWAGQNPNSPNLGAAEDFAEAVLERARVRALTRYPGEAAYKNQLDVLVIGAEYGEYAGKHFAADLEGVFPGLKIDAVDSKAFSVDPEKFAIGPNTIVLAISHSGQYFHTVDDVSFLNALHERGRCGPVFGMAGLIDSVPLGQALGQSYKASAKSNRRLFVTHAGLRLDEPKPVVPLATEMTLSHLMVNIAEKAKNKKFGRSADDETIRRLKEGQTYLQERSESIFGINRKGQKVDAQEHKELVAVGHHYSQRLTEFLIAMPLAAVHLFVVLYFGGSPIQGGFDLLFSFSQWGVFSNATTLGHFIVTYWQVPYFIMAYFVAAFVVRLVQRRPLWGRYVSAPTLFLGDTYFVHKTMEVYLRKLFSLSYGWASWGEFKTGETRAGYTDEVNPSVKRGDFMVTGLPMQNGMHAMTQMISTQLRGSLSMDSTAEAFALGHQPPSHGKFDKHSVLAGEDSSRVEDVLGTAPDGGRLDLLESRVFSIERLMAFDVIFHANAARTRDWTNRFVLVLRWVAWPLLFLVRVISFGKFKVPLFPWDIAETHGRANIFTTQVGKPISVSVEKFSPRAFHVNGEPAAPRAPPTDFPLRIEALIATSENPMENLMDQPQPTDKKPLAALTELAIFLGLPSSRATSVVPLKAEIRDFLKTNKNPLTIPVIHQEALLSALAGKVGVATPVQIRLGNGSEDPSVSIAKYRNLRKSGKLDAPESLVVAFSEGEGFLVRLVSLTKGTEFLDVSHNGGGHVTVVPMTSHPLPDALPPAGEGARSEASEVDHTAIAERQNKEGLVSLAKFLGLSHDASKTVDQLERDIRVMLSSSKQVDIPSEHEVALVLALLSAETYVRIMYEEEGIQMLSLETFRDRRVNRWANNSIPEWESFRVVHHDGHFLLSETPVDTAEKSLEVESSDHRAGLLALAGYLNLAGAEQYQDVPLADHIEEALKAHTGTSLRIPGEYEDGLIAVFAHAQHRNTPPVRALFNNGRTTSFPESLDVFLGKRNNKSTSWEKYYVSYHDDEGGVRFFSVFPNPEVTEGVSSAEKEPEVRAYDEYPPMSWVKSASEVSTVQETEADPVKGAAVANADQNLAVEVLAEQETVSSEDRDYRTFLLNVVGKTVRITVVLMTSVLLISWGGPFVSSVEGALSRMMNKPEAHQLRNVLGTARSSQFVIPDNAPRAFVNTKKTPLMSFDRSPAEKNRVVGRVGANSTVKMVESKGSWILVSERSGKRGWVNIRSLRAGQGGTMTAVKSVALFEHTPALRMENLQKGTQVAVLGYQGKWARVVPLEQPKTAVWVSREYISEVKEQETAQIPHPALRATFPQEGKERRDSPPALPVEIVPEQVQEIVVQLGKPVPVLGQMARRALSAVVSQNSPGSVLHQRLLAGSLHEFEAGATRVAAEDLVSFVDHPAAFHLDQAEQQLVLAVGYGAVAGESWSQKGAPKDRALYDDYRRTRAIVNGRALSAPAGRALTRLARRASGWKRNTAPVYASGALPVINLSEAEQDSSLLSHWAVALSRAAEGEPAPVVVARNAKQQAHLEAGLAAWRQSHPEVSLTDDGAARSQWILLDPLGSDVVVRDGEGIPQTVRLGALLGTVGVQVSSLVAVDIVTGVQSKVEWDRSDVPAKIAVRMIIGLLKDLSLSAPLKEAQDSILSARKALTAA